MSRSSEQLSCGRLEREHQTVRAMVQIYCAGHHGRSLCGDCQELMAYAACRLQRCPFAAEKPTCAKCPIHCYKPEMRERVKSVMRYAGPRMLFRHPWLAVRHWLDSLLAPTPERSNRGKHAKP
jgi:hypothetical protein